jgi:hypothetical protein
MGVDEQCLSRIEGEDPMSITVNLNEEQMINTGVFFCVLVLVVEERREEGGGRERDG